ncbi:MAG: hypothetical protein CVV45_09890 [Spirochaetae bacterium HGW-Spirochaetae-10]|nr:MAG: hypothetical protein CVV45_09890 [Spirochaetae bacterium HGW-Spirochaetae-10]
MKWEVDKKTGIATLGSAAVQANGQGRIRMSMHNAILSAAAPEEAGAAGEAQASYRMEGDFLIRPFRMLSAVLIEGYWLDFTDASVLEKAVAMFGGVTIYANHDPDVRDWLGVTLNPRFTNSQGIAGVDADYKIDAVSNPRIVRGLSMDPPALHSTSVEVHFQADRSHGNMGWEFWENLGREVDGEIVRFVIRSIRGIGETSLVYSGADPYAKALSSEESGKGKGILTMNRNEQNGDGTGKTEIESLKADLAAMKKQEGETRKSLEAYEALGSVEHFKALVDGEAKRLEEQRADAMKAYLAVEGESASDAMKTLIEKASLEEATNLAATFKRKLEDKHPVTCPKCGAAGLTRASSSGSSDHAGGAQPADEDSIPMDSVRMESRR